MSHRWFVTLLSLIVVATTVGIVAIIVLDEPEPIHLPAPVIVSGAPESDAAVQQESGSASTQGSDAGVDVVGGLRLLPGDDGTLPVKVRWTYRLVAPETFVVHDGVVYVSDEGLVALRLSDGTKLWEQYGDEDEGLAADGGVMIGTDGPGRIRVFGPYNFDLVVRQGDGGLIRFRRSPVGDAPSALHGWHVRPTRTWNVEARPESFTARKPDGTTAWRLTDFEPMFQEEGPIDVDGGWLLMTSSGYLVSLEPA